MKKPQVLTDLENVYALIKDKERWAQDAFARGKNGEDISPTSKLAVCWCGAGAIEKVCGRSLKRFDAICSLVGSSSQIVAINDGEGGHEAVCKILLEAIDRLKNG